MQAEEENSEDVQRVSTLPGEHLPNEDFVLNLMRYGPTGALTQVFVIEALRYYAEQIIKQDRPKNHGTGMISNIAWWDTAAGVMERLESKYGKS